MQTKIRVLCVDDNEDIPLLLGRFIDAEEDMESAGSLYSADNLRAEIERTRADVVLLDLKMPGKDSFEAMEELARPASKGVPGRRDVHVIAYSGRDDEATVRSAARAGADAYLSKDAAPPRMVEAIREVARGGAFKVWLSNH